MSSPSRFRPYRRLERINAIIALPLCALLVPLPVIAQTAPVVVAPGSGNTRTYTTPAGVPVVDINTANTAGLSHNKYTHYNVPGAGLVLNNSTPTQFTVQSQLAGGITVNFNTKTPAQVILNEVVAPNSTTIAGFTEVVGSKADLVVANPYGIAVRGGGFINTDRVTLATGTPVFAANGGLSGLQVTGGELTLSQDAQDALKNGLNAANVGVLNLLARSIKIDGQLNAQDLVVVAGAHDFDLESRAATARESGTGAAPAVALDSTAVGGMYANRIRLVATDAGVGVRMLGDVAATVDDLNVDAAGKVELANRTSAERDVIIAANGGITVSGSATSVAAKRDMTLDAKSSAAELSEATLVADRDLTMRGGSLADTGVASAEKPNRYAGNALSIATTNLAAISGSFYAAGDTVTVQAGTATFSDLAKFYAGVNQGAGSRSLQVRTTVGNLDAGNAQLLAENAATLFSERGAVRIADSGTGAGVQAAGDATVAAATEIANAGNVASGRALDLRALNAVAPVVVTNSGKLIAGEALSFGRAGEPLALNNETAGVIGGRAVELFASRATNAGAIQGTRGVTLNVAEALANGTSGTIVTGGEAARDISITAGSLDNAGTIQSTGAVALKVAGEAANSGVVATRSTVQDGANGGITLAARALKNSGVVQSAGELGVTVNGTSGATLTNSGTLQAVQGITLLTGSRFENSGAVLGGAAVAVRSGAGAFELANAGRIQAAGALSLGEATARTVLEQTSSAVTLAGGALAVRASRIDNAGILQAADALTLDVTGALHNRAGGGVLTANAAGKDIVLTSASLTNAGQIQSTGAINATVSGAAENTGTMVTLKTEQGGAAKAIALRADTFVNRGTMQSAAALDLTALSRSGTTFANEGTLAAASHATLLVGAEIKNAASGSVIAEGDLAMRGGTSAGGFALTNAGRLQAGGTLALGTAGQPVKLANEKGGVVLSGAALDVTATNLANAGTLQAKTGFTATVAEALTNTVDGTMLTHGQAGANVVLDAATFTNAGMLQSAGAFTATVKNTLTNSGGVVTTFAADGGAAGAWKATAAAIENSGNFISSGALQLTSQTKFANSGLVQAAGAMTLTTRELLDNATTGKVLGGGDVTLVSGADAWTLTNAGRIQSAGTLQVATSAAKATVTNTDTGIVFAGGTFDVDASTIANRGTLRGTSAADFRVTNAFTNENGVVATAGKEGATLTVAAGTLTNSGTGQFQSAGKLRTTVIGALINSGVMLTRATNDGGSAGAIDATSATFNNSGTVQSAGTLAITATAAGDTPFVNSGLLQAASAIDVIAPTRQEVTSTGIIRGGADVTLRSAGETFRLENAGLVQAAANLTLGGAGEAVTLVNTGSALAGAGLSATATTVDNAGTIQGATFVRLDASDAVTNSGVIAATDRTGQLSLNAASLNNSGSIQSAGSAGVATSGEVGNTGMIAAADYLSVSASTMNNSGMMSGGGHLGVSTSGSGGSTVANSGRMLSDASVDVLARGGILNTGSGVIDGADSVNIRSGDAAGFTLDNNGYVQSNGSVTLGNSTERAEMTNSGSVVAGSVLNVTATTVGNSGKLQSGAGLVVDASSSMNNSGTVSGGSHVGLSAASLTNSNKIQSSGSLASTTTGETTNTGTIATTGGALSATASKLTNNGTVSAVGNLAITTNGADATTLVNNGAIRATGKVDLTTKNGVLNSATGVVHGDGNVTLISGGGGFTVTNAGSIQSGADLAVGTVTQPAALNNQLTGLLRAGGNLAVTATTITNAGTIQGASAVTLSGTGALSNVASGNIAATGGAGSSVTVTAASITNAGQLQSAGTLAATASGAISNSGTWLTTGTGAGAISANGATITNTATIQSAAALTLAATTDLTNAAAARLQSAGDLALTASGRLSNAGDILSGAHLVVHGGSSAFEIINDGRMQAAQNFTFGAAGVRAAVTNAATGVMQSGAALNGFATTLTNSGVVQSTGAMTLNASGALANNAGAKVLTAGDGTAALQITAASLTNAGTVQSTGSLTSTTTGSLSNTGTLITTGSGAFAATASTITNGSTIQSGGTLALTATNSSGTTLSNTGTVRGADAVTLTAPGTLNNSAAGKIVSTAGAITLLGGSAAFALTNDGLVQAGDTLSVGTTGARVALTNAGTMSSGGALAINANAFTNSGTVQAGGSGTINFNSGAVLNNQAAGKIITGDTLTIDTSSGNFTLSNAGLVQSGGLLTLGGAGRLVTINQTATTSKLFSDTFAITAGAITNKGMIMGAEGGTLTATSFLNDNSTSRFIAATGNGATTVTISGGLTNEGAIHSGGNLTLNASHLTNTSTGGISSLANLTLNATGSSIVNESNGALYTGGKLTLTAADDITNHEDATIDTDGDFAVTATNAGSVFLNQGQINIGGNATISVRTFQNVMAGAENLSREWRGLSSDGSDIRGNISGLRGNYYSQSAWVFGDVPEGAESLTEWYYTGNGGYSGSLFDDRKSTVNGFFYRKEVFDGIADPGATFGNKPKPQISAANLTLNGFDTGKNVGGLLTATGTLAVTGRTNGSSFLNDAMALEREKWNYQATWWYDYTTGSYDWWNPTGEGPNNDHPISGRLTTISSANNYFSIGAGIRAGTITVTNVGSLTNLGSPVGPDVDSRTQNGAATESLAATQNVAGATATTGTSIAATGNASAFGGANALTLGGVTLDGGVSAQTKGQANFASAADFNPATSASLRSGGASTSSTATQLAAGKLSGAASAASRFGAQSAAAFANALKNATVALGTLSLRVPTNPNGFFVANADPKAKFLVSVNATFGIDPSTATGSDKLFEELGVDPDRVQQRLGDAAYETYLVRQQLVDQLGTKLLTGQKNEAAQMASLMANAASEAKRLGLQLGQAPTPAQLANLSEDMVWMVEQVVAGQRVLVPQVYVSAKTKSLFEAEGANIAGDNVSLDVGTLANTGGNISGSENLAIKASGDIKNTGGSISGGNVSLDAGGSIINETITRGNADSSVVGKTASITSTGTMDLSALKDIKILGADVKAGGDASISAGGEIVVDTVQAKTTTRTSSGSSGFIGSSSTTTTTTDVKNQASNLDFGGNLKLKSGGDTTLAGSNLNVGGNLDADVGGNLNVLARQDQHTVNTESSTSGVGVGGGLYGSQTTTTNDFTGTNVGSKINVGGDANLKAAKTLTLEGSDLDVKGGGSIEAKDILVLDGKDERRTTTTTTTTTFGVFSDSGSAAGTETESGAKNASANASASASAEGNAGTTIGVRTNTTTTEDYESKSRASTIKFGGDLKIEAKETLITRGSDIEAGGNVDLKAKDMLFLAGQDLKTSTTTSETTTAGLNFSAEGSAEASASAGAGPMAAGGKAEASAGGEVSAGIMVQNNKTKTSEGSSTARVSTIKSGGNLTRTAENAIVDVGTNIEVGGDLTQEAKTITSLAAKNETWSSEDSTTHTGKIGLYADANASASAEANASTNLGGGVNASGGAEAEASVTAGLKAQYTFESSSSSERTSEAVVSNIKVGGNLTSKSSGKTTLEGTNIEVGGDATIEAKSLDYRAAQNTSTSSSSEANADATLKMGVGAGASANTDGDASAGYGLQGSLAVSGGKSTSSESSSEAVTGSLVTGGKLTIKTKEDMRFEGTNLESTGDTKLKAGGNVTFDAARNTSESSADSFNASAELSANTYGGSKSVSGGVEGGFSKERSSSSDAVTGSIKSGGGLTIEAGGDATFEGTDLSAKGDATVDAKGSVSFKQATSTSSSTSSELSASLSAGGEKGGDGGSSKEFEAGVEGGYSTESSKTAKTSTLSTGGSLTIKSGKDTTLQGTNIESAGDVNVEAKGNLNLTAKEESSSSFGVSGSLGVGGGSSTEGGETTKSKSASGEIALEGEKSVTREGGTIKSGGSVNLGSGKNTTFVGTQVESAGDINVQAGGSVTQKAAESSSIGGAIGLSASHETETKGPARTGAGAGTSGGGAAAGGGTAGTTGAGDQKAGDPNAKAGADAKKDDAPKPSAGITQIGLSGDSSTQKTSFKSGSGNVNVQPNAKSDPKSGSASGKK